MVRDTKENIETILAQLSSPKGKIGFLESIYRAGITDAADYLLELSPIPWVLEAEVGRANTAGNADRAVALSKLLIDEYVKLDVGCKVRDVVVESKNPLLANYAVEQLSTNIKEGREEVFLEFAADIAAEFKRTELATQLYEKVLGLYEQKNIAYSQAWICVKLGRFDKAIDLYKKESKKENQYELLGYAISVAREHKPERLNEIAALAFKRFSPDSHNYETYISAAEILGKTEEAKAVLGEKAKKADALKLPIDYAGLITGLIALGMKTEAQSILAKKVDYYEKQSKPEDALLHHHYQLKDVAELCENAGDAALTKKAYLLGVESGLECEIYPSEILSFIEKGFKATGDSIFLEKKLRVLEEQQNYVSASKVAAEELGRRDMARVYTLMHEMVQSAKALPNE